ncbi:heavy-metal-associated domain-containing protein [Microbispora sp. SCL1-1]|nr:heavy-metal-associated domain-containing protein [Microbispora sp. SCL1-1]
MEVERAAPHPAPGGGDGSGLPGSSVLLGLPQQLVMPQPDQLGKNGEDDVHVRSVAVRAVRGLAAGFARPLRHLTDPDSSGQRTDSRSPGRDGTLNGMADQSRQGAAAETTVCVPALLCRRCVRLLSRHVRDVPGVSSFEVDAGRGLLRVRGVVDPAELRAALASAGFSGDRCEHRDVSM